MKKIKISYTDILVLNTVINELPDRGSLKLKHRIVSISRAIKPIIEDLNKLIEWSEEFKDYRNKLDDIYKKHCETKDGSLVLYSDEDRTNISTNIRENIFVKFNDENAEKNLTLEVDAFKKEHQSIIDARDKIADEYKEHIKEEIEIEMQTISFDDLDTINKGLLPGDKDYFDFNYGITVSLYPILED